MRLLSSIDGAIEHVLLFAPAYEAEHFASVYAALINSLPENCRYTLVAEPGARGHIDRWTIAAARRANISIINSGKLSLTAWARDPLLAARDADGQPLLYVTSELDRRDDLKAAHLLVGAGDIAITDAAFSFEGGNILIGGNHIFVGLDTPDILDHVASVDKEFVSIGCAEAVPEETSRQAMSGDDEWREIFHYRNKMGSHQPIFHIDMFMTLAGPGADGREQILVGDPAMAGEILETPLHPLALAAQLDGIADDLIARGFAVIRNPLPMIYMDDVKKRVRTWFYASSNNVLVQKSAQKVNAVWMSEYGHDHWPELSKTDVCNAKIWEKLGFKVHMIPGGQRLAENLGGLHCLTNVLKRG